MLKNLNPSLCVSSIASASLTKIVLQSAQIDFNLAKFFGDILLFNDVAAMDDS
jgi:hypothetical protein